MVEQGDDREKLLTRVLWLAPLMVALVSLLDIWRGEVPIDYEFYDNAAKGLAAATPPYQAEDFPLAYPPGCLYLLLPLGYVSTNLGGVLFGILVWAGAIAGSVLWSRRVGPKIPASYAAAAGLMFFPLYRALEPLNMAVLLFAIVVFYAPSTRPRGAIADFLVGWATGFVISIKPHWLSIAAPMLSMQRRWAGLVGLFTGTATLLAVSLAHTELWDAFIYRITHEVGSHWTFDLWRFGAVVGGSGFVLWCAVAGWVWWRKHPDAWLFSLTAILIWPRPTGYGYIVLLPVLFYLWSRVGKWKWVMIAAFSTPLGLASILDVADGGVVMEIGYTWRTTLLSYSNYAFTLALAAHLAWRFTRSQVSESAE